MDWEHNTKHRHRETRRHGAQYVRQTVGKAGAYRSNGCQHVPKHNFMVRCRTRGKGTGTTNRGVFSMQRTADPSDSRILMAMMPADGAISATSSAQALPNFFNVHHQLKRVFRGLTNNLQDGQAEAWTYLLKQEGEHKNITVVTLAFPHRENLSDNLACGPNISCLSQSNVRGPPNAYSSTVVDAQGQWLTVNNQWSLVSER